MKIVLNGVYCSFNDEYPEGLLFDVSPLNIQAIILAMLDINEQGRLVPAANVYIFTHLFSDR